MSDTYYQYRETKVKIVHRLFNMMGWTVYGYSGDNIDPMTDYYDPAYWGGIAEKNGYILVVDRKNGRTEPEYYTIKTQKSEQTDAETAAKIAKLEQMTQARGASEQEEATAKAKIAALRNKASKADGITEEKKLITPAHKANPPRCNWHIEKDGIIIDKGTGLLKFSSVPDISGNGYRYEVEEWQKFNNLSEDEWKNEYIKKEVYKWGENERERATKNAESSYKYAKEKYDLLEKFNALLARWNNICGGMVSNGSGEDVYIYEEVTITEYKEELKPQETAGSIKEGQCFILKSNFTYGKNKGYVYRIHESKYTDKDGTEHISFRAYKLGKGYKKECKGTADNANIWYLWDLEKFEKWIEKGAIAFCDLVEVKTPYEVKKVVKKAVHTEARTAEQTDFTEKEEMSSENMDCEKTGKNADVLEENEAENSNGIIDCTGAKNNFAIEKDEKQTNNAITEESVSDMFEELAKAFITGKQAPRKSTKAAEPPKEEEPQEEPQPYIIGYHGQASDIFTVEEIQALINGAQIHKGEKWTERTYIATPYTAAATHLVYSISGAEIEPERDAKYCGFLANGAFYSNMDTIKSKLAEDINKAIIDHINSENAAKALFDTLPPESYERRDIDHYISTSRERAAKDFFYNDKKPELRLYGTGRDIKTADLIRYISEPEKTVKTLADAYTDSHKAHIYREWIEYARTTEELKKIIQDTTHEAYTIKRLQKAVNDEKTVKILLTNGKEVRAEANALKNIGAMGYISSWSVQASDRQHLTNREIKPDDIRLITHGGRILYKAS